MKTTTTRQNALQNVSSYMTDQDTSKGHGYLVRDLGFSDPVINETQSLIMSRPVKGDIRLQSKTDHVIHRQVD